ncbi:hypothetical protein ADICYQ_0994 [Cyclobacterium qasimii M12-11B]|uniref:Uncharacterized protein n=1 Tax=Cyclobacterium qasimii M12-11B TaxID=641524 RepID=S7VK46_9BACT|nr:hypothetical protein ADICYQ_0994 [Cyclobacterium qasimii M12-11B]
MQGENTFLSGEISIDNLFFSVFQYTDLIVINIKSLPH